MGLLITHYRAPHSSRPPGTCTSWWLFLQGAVRAFNPHEDPLPQRPPYHIPHPPSSPKGVTINLYCDEQISTLYPRPSNFLGEVKTLFASHILKDILRIQITANLKEKRKYLTSYFPLFKWLNQNFSLYSMTRTKIYKEGNCKTRLLHNVITVIPNPHS